jgi:hypothetical protein
MRANVAINRFKIADTDMDALRNADCVTDYG